LDDFWKKEQKLAWFAERSLEKIEFDNIVPDKNNNWLNLIENDWEDLMPLVSKKLTSETLFKEYTIGSNTARDEWAYAFEPADLQKKIEYFIDTYNKKLSDGTSYQNDTSIKWTRGLKRRFDKKLKLDFHKNKIIKAFYRPFANQYLYHSNDLIEMPSLLPKLAREENLFIIFSGSSHSKPFQTYVANNVFSFDFLEKTTGLPLYDFDKSGHRIDNITDWGLQQFTDHYASEENYEKLVKEYVEYDQSNYPEGALTINSAFHGIAKEDIFYYVYAVLHNPAYRKKYELNLKREFPRIPFYAHFYKWVKWGEQLMELHINYESVQPYPLVRKEVSAKEEPKAKLKALKETGVIQLDENTELHGIPKEAWEYQLGNRSALEWILDQYKEKKPKDPTIAEKFNTYKFADYKEKVIDLLGRACRVSVETVRVVGEMEGDSIKAV
jgi:predicted helicase